MKTYLSDLDKDFNKHCGAATINLNFVGLLGISGGQNVTDKFCIDRQEQFQVVRNDSRSVYRQHYCQ